jgi:hypothetical protein
MKVSARASLQQVVPSGAWLTLPGSVGVTSEALASEITAAVSDKIARGTYSAGEVVGIAGHRLRSLDPRARLSEARLEQVRTLCRLWEVDLRATAITSHRPLIGPCIVAAKKLLVPFIRLVLGNTLRQQREFNAATLALLIDLARERESFNASK